MRPIHQCTALLFDGSTPDSISRLFIGAKKYWVVYGDEPNAKHLLRHTLDNIDATVRTTGMHIVLSMSYEALSAFSIADGLHLSTKPSSTPWLQALAFDPPQKLNRGEALEWLQRQGQGSTIHLTPTTSSMTEHQFTQHIDTIRTLIAAGDTYQVNYTFPLTNELLAHTTQGHDSALAAVYHQLVQDLRIPYGALITLPENSLLSFSPELFVEMTPNSLTCRPMKGTVAVSDSDVENTRRAAELAMDSKNRAENLMIVDLMRNDLSHLKEVIKVNVPKLFEVKRYGAVLQMTSTIKAYLSKQPSLTALFDALFPCGSITGAPKHHTIEIIDALETQARNAYCGAIGFIEPEGQDINLILSVPIRTIQTTTQPTIDALGIEHWPLHLSVGAGITYDSVATDEWHESILKAKFLTQHTQVFELIETMRIEKGTVSLLNQHIKRLQDSTVSLGWIKPDSINIHKAIQADLTQSKQTGQTLRLRLALTADGHLSTQSVPLKPLDTPVHFALHAAPMYSSNPFLRHKTSVRAQYNIALQTAKTIDLFDWVFLNEKGQITEGTRSNIFIQLNGAWYTPPLNCGVLPGVQRSVLITQLRAHEKILNADDLIQAEQIVLCNALYGALPAKLIHVH